MAFELKVYAFKYNNCIFESAWATMSLHLDRRNAKKALWRHMKECFLEYKKYKKECMERGLGRPEFGWSEHWYVAEVDIQP